MTLKTLFSGMLLLAATTASAQYVHIELKNGEKYDYDSKDIKTMTVDNQAPKPAAPQPGDKVEGTDTVDGMTYTKAVGGTVGEAVDLGLPSGTLWASLNIGASQPEEYGAYLAWAEVGAKEEGYVDGIKSNYTWSTTKYCEGTYRGPFSKYVASSPYGTVDNKKVLEAMDDAATVNWGDDWRMPTYEEQTELCTKCTWTWVTTDVKGANGYFVEGYKVVGPNGNYIFLPASGGRDDSSLYDVGSWGYYWSSSLRTNNSYNACNLGFKSGRNGWYYDYRSRGFSVRPVRAQN